MNSKTPTSDYVNTDSNYLHANPTWHVEDSAGKATQVLKLMQRNKLQPRSIVEIGCGAGGILNQLQLRLEDKTIEFAGYEIAPDAFKLAQTREKARLHFFQQNLLETNNYYDLLLMINVFEHVDDYLGFIKAAGSKAAYKIYHIPLDMSAFSILTNYPAGAHRNVGHLHYFMKDTALATLTDAGEEVIDWFYTPGAFEINNKGLSLGGKLIQFLRRIVYKANPDLSVKMFGGFSLIVLTK